MSKRINAKSTTPATKPDLAILRTQLERFPVLSPEGALALQLLAAIEEQGVVS